MIGIQDFQELLTSQNLPFQIVLLKEWRGNCPVSQEPHKKVCSTVCFSCRKVYVQKAQYPLLTLEEIGAATIFIGKMFHKRILKETKQ